MLWISIAIWLGNQSSNYTTLVYLTGLIATTLIATYRSYCYHCYHSSSDAHNSNIVGGKEKLKGDPGYSAVHEDATNQIHTRLLVK